MNYIKKLFKENSIYLIIVTILETILSIVMTLSFVYTDSLNYSDSLVFQADGIQKLLQSMYSSTYWALILLLLSFIAIFSITTLIYHKMEYEFISILCWFEMFILAINFTKSLTDNLSTVALFIPIIIICIISYHKEKDKIKVLELKTKKH